MIDNTENMTLKEKCYAYQHEANYFLDPNKYIIAHLDGRSFSTLIKNKFNKPFDINFIKMMNETAIYLCKEVNGVKFAYVQSDEISLVIKKNREESMVFFDGRVCKMQSIMASLATAKFNQLMTKYHLDKAILDLFMHGGVEITNELITETINDSPLYQFDCKVWNVDNANDAMAWILFRNIDCIRNSKQQTAQTWLSYNDLLRLNADEQIALLKERNGVDWNTFEAGRKYGRIVKKVQKYYKTLSGVEYIRNVWEATDGCDLTNQDNRTNLINELNIIDNYGNDNGQEII